MNLVPTGERQPCQIYSRVNGWLVPKHACNPGKQAEWSDRKMYIIDINKLSK